MNQNKKIIKKTGAAFLCAAMVANAGTASVMAVDNRKDENVYVNLNMDGSVSGVYVVNEYNLTEKQRSQIMEIMHR